MSYVMQQVTCGRTLGMGRLRSSGPQRRLRTDTDTRPPHPPLLPQGLCRVAAAESDMHDQPEL